MGVNLDNMMMCGLFSSFDPVTWESGFSSKWIYSGLGVSMMCVMWQVFSVSGGFELIKENLIMMISREVRQLSKFPKESMLMHWSVFSLIVVWNLSGLTPYSFTLTTHLCINMSMSIPLWGMGVMLYFWKSLDNFTSHFLPTGSPVALWPFLVAIEMVSWLIRPITLSIRLMANMMAGHLITSLLSGLISNSSVCVILLPLQSGLIAYEVGVSMIQAYVFMSLIVMYSGEGE